MLLEYYVGYCKTVVNIEVEHSFTSVIPLHNAVPSNNISKVMVFICGTYFGIKLPHDYQYFWGPYNQVKPQQMERADKTMEAIPGTARTNRNETEGRF